MLVLWLIYAATKSYMMHKINHVQNAMEEASFVEYEKSRREKEAESVRRKEQDAIEKSVIDLDG